jgi:hypothetical protein
MSRRRFQSIISGVLLVVSAMLLALVAVLYFQEDDQPEEPARATAVPGHYQLIDIVEAIEDTGEKVTIGDASTNVRSTMLATAGQLLKVGDGSVYVFIYPDISSQEAATLDVEAGDVDLIALDGSPIEFEDATLSAKSNVAVMIIDLDDKTTTKIDKAIQALP